MKTTRTSRTFVRNGDLGVDVHLTLEEAKRIRTALSAYCGYCFAKWPSST